MHIHDLQIEDSTIVHARGAECIELGEGETASVIEQSGGAPLEHAARNLMDILDNFTDSIPLSEVGVSHQQLRKDGGIRHIGLVQKGRECKNGLLMRLRFYSNAWLKIAGLTRQRSLTGITFLNIMSHISFRILNQQTYET